MVCGPLPSSASGLTDQVPSGLTMAEPMGALPSLMMTMSPAWAPLPVKVGLESSVVPPEATLPLAGPTLSMAPPIAGVGGMVDDSAGTFTLTGWNRDRSPSVPRKWR